MKDRKDQNGKKKKKVTEKTSMWTHLSEDICGLHGGLVKKMEIPLERYSLWGNHFRVSLWII